MRTEEAAVRLFETTGLLRLTGVGLDDSDSGDPFLQGREVRADIVTNVEVGGVGVTLEFARRNDNDRHHQERHDRELPRQDQQQDEREGKQQCRRDELEEAPLDEFGHRLDVGSHSSDEDARLVAVKEGKRLLLDVAEHSDTKQPKETLAGPVDEDVLLTGRHVGNRHHDDVRNDGGPQRATISRFDAVVDPVANNDRAHQQTERRNGGKADCRQDRSFERRRHPGRTTHDLLGRVGVKAVLFLDRIHAPHQLRPDPVGPAAARSASLMAASTSR